jgi:Na+-driven multidrug efflux pump
VRFLQPLMLGTVFYYLSMLYAAVLRGVGNTRLPFVIALIATAINVAVNYALILGNWGFPALGTRGAAIGTVIAQVFSVVALVVQLKRGAVKDLGIRLAPAKIDGALARELFRIGAPAALDLLVLNVSFISVLGMLGYIDQLAVAAHGIGLRIQSLAFVPGLSISLATSAMVGNALGAGNADQARQVSRASAALCTVIMSAIAIVLVLGADPIVRIFDVDPATALGRYSIEWIRLLGYAMPATGLHIAYTGVLRGSGATWTSLYINLATTIIQVPMSAVLGFSLGWGAWGVWAAFPASFVLKAALSYYYVRRGRWAKVGVHA